MLFDHRLSGPRNILTFSISTFLAPHDINILTLELQFATEKRCSLIALMPHGFVSSHGAASGSPASSCILRQ